jgi:hypothetical protein
MNTTPICVVVGDILLELAGKDDGSNPEKVKNETPPPITMIAARFHPGGGLIVC